jgi:Tfp pilus assembly protein PilV
MTRHKNSLGFSAVEVLLVLVVIGILGFTGWFVYQSRQTANKDYTTQSSAQTPTAKKSTITPANDAKTKAMATWSDFSNTTVGLKFRYPSDWGQATFETMNSTPSDANGTFYKVSFGARMFTYLTVTPKAAVKDYSTTFTNLKDSNVKYASTRRVFVNQATIVGAVVPDGGNQQATIYAARAIALKKVDASDIQLFDAKYYDTSCTQSTYVSCYTTDELNDYQWLLESVSTL